MAKKCPYCRDGFSGYRGKIRRDNYKRYHEECFLKWIAEAINPPLPVSLPGINFYDLKASAKELYPREKFPKPPKKLGINNRPWRSV